MHTTDNSKSHTLLEPDRRPCKPRLFLIMVVAAVLSSCKVIVTVPFGGEVVTEDGFVCRAGETCEVNVSNEFFDSTFTAVAAEGYTFVRWRVKPGAFCGNAAVPCYLTTDGFEAYPELMAYLDSDLEYYLEPVFVQYDPAYWQKVLAEIEAGSFTGDDFLYALKPDTANCDPGALTEAAKERALLALNKTRALHHLPAVEQDSFYDMQVQEASLVQRANNRLNHFPSPGDKCYTASAETGSSTSNLGASNGQSKDPVSDVIIWTNDNTNIAVLMEAGHRRWLLYPSLGYMSYGQVEGFSALKVFDFGNSPPDPLPAALEFVAMPYESYPYILVSQGDAPTPWSFSMVPPAGVASDFNYFQNAQVKITEIDSGKSLSVQNLHKDNKGFGLANFLSWMVVGWEHDVPYTVKISGIARPGGGTETIEYPVVIDRYNLFNVDHRLEASDKPGDDSPQGKFNNPADKDSYQISLVGKTMVSGQSEFSNQAFFILVYDSLKRLVKSSDKAFSHNFPLGKYTFVASLCDEDGLCYQDTKTYRIELE